MVYFKSKVLFTSALSILLFSGGYGWATHPVIDNCDEYLFGAAGPIESCASNVPPKSFSNISPQEFKEECSKACEPSSKPHEPSSKPHEHDNFKTDPGSKAANNSPVLTSTKEDVVPLKSSSIAPPISSMEYVYSLGSNAWNWATDGVWNIINVMDDALDDTLDYLNYHFLVDKPKVLYCQDAKNMTIWAERPDKIGDIRANVLAALIMRYFLPYAPDVAFVYDKDRDGKKYLYGYALENIPTLNLAYASYENHNMRVDGKVPPVLHLRGVEEWTAMAKLLDICGDLHNIGMRTDTGEVFSTMYQYSFNGIMRPLKPDDCLSSERNSFRLKCDLAKEKAMRAHVVENRFAIKAIIDVMFDTLKEEFKEEFPEEDNLKGKLASYRWFGIKKNKN